MSGQPSHYEMLGVAATASAEEVRAAFRRAARDHHPDAGGDSRRMRDLNAAWHVLGDPARRAAYDRGLAARAATASPAAAGPADTAGDTGGWEVDADGYRTAEEWAELADDRPFGETRALEGWWAILPPATLVAAVAAFFGAFIFGSSGLLALAGGLCLLAAGLFVLAPLRAMSRR
ncbi:MAG TPA: DnaJ domain-containing protein [Acidimicrobiales bacterium]|nr:DnaJ domain-containing protein [Acidimicrobiales bacterium]